MKKVLFSLIALAGSLMSCITGGTKSTSDIKEGKNDSLILRQDSSDLVRVVSSGGFDTLVYEKDIREVQEEHHRRYAKGPFHSRSIKNGVSTHYACTHSSHYSQHNSNWQ